MKTLRLALIASVCSCSLWFSSVVSAAFIIDDFNVNSTSFVIDNAIGGQVTGSSTIDGSNIVMGGAGWSRSIVADLTGGDQLQTTVCSNCQAGHVTMTANNSIGTGIFSYSGSAIDLSGYTGLFFDWGADLQGASVDIIFHDASTSNIVASWSSLADTGGSSPAELVTQATMGIAWGSLDSTAITRIDFVVNGVANMDTIIDNITAVVPVPAAVWLFGSGLLGLVGFARKRKS